MTQVSSIHSYYQYYSTQLRSVNAMLVRSVSASAWAPLDPILLKERLMREGVGVWEQYGHSISTPTSLLFYLLSNFIYRFML